MRGCVEKVRKCDFEGQAEEMAGGGGMLMAGRPGSKGFKPSQGVNWVLFRVGIVEEAVGFIKNVGSAWVGLHKFNVIIHQIEENIQTNFEHISKT